MSGKDSITWKVALLGAVSALLGSAIGVLSSVAIARTEFDRQDRAQLRSDQRFAYIRFLREAQRQEGILAALPLQNASLAPKVKLARLDSDLRQIQDLGSSMSAAQSLAIVYDSFAATKEALEVSDALADARGTAVFLLLDSKKKQFEKDLSKVSSEITDFQFAIRPDLRTDQL